MRRIARLASNGESHSWRPILNCNVPGELRRQVWSSFGRVSHHKVLPELPETRTPAPAFPLLVCFAYPPLRRSPCDPLVHPLLQHVHRQRAGADQLVMERAQ